MAILLERCSMGIATKLLWSLPFVFAVFRSRRPHTTASLLDRTSAP
jgi:hypothetical protein